MYRHHGRCVLGVEWEPWESMVDSVWEGKQCPPCEPDCCPVFRGGSLFTQFSRSFLKSKQKSERAYCVPVIGNKAPWMECWVQTVVKVGRTLAVVGFKWFLSGALLRVGA